MFFNEIFDKFQTGNILAYIALVLAYLAYRKSLLDEYQSWLDLFESFKHDLKYSNNWIGNCYKNKFKKEWSDPSKIIYPLTFESVKALIWKGHPPKGLFSDDFFDKLAIFNERIKAFNHLLLLQGINYLIPQKEELAQKKASYINSTIHNKLIGNDGVWDLYNLYRFFKEEEKLIKERGLNKVSFFIRKPAYVIFISTTFYILIDFFF